MFDNTYVTLPERFYARVAPAAAPAPTLLAFNDDLAAHLGLDGLAQTGEQAARIFSGNELPVGAEPLAMAYAGHQFAYFVPQLGDGRAILLGEVLARDGRRYDVQLKGAGRTPYSRGGDGRSALGPVIREYLLSEAMHALGVSTTRALAAVRTGETVYRDEALPGAVLTRVAASHLRIGTFEYFAARSDVEAVRALADYAIARHYPEAADDARPRVALVGRVVEAQARLVADWMALGFVHGVMNTDNTSISGETIDYGPCAFLDEFHVDKVFSSIDRRGRYAYGQQGAIAQWNLTRLAETLLLAEADRPLFEAQLERFASLFEEAYLARMRRKLGLATQEAADGELVSLWLQHLQDEGLDYTLSFRRLAERAAPGGEPLFGDFEARWRERLAREPDDAVAVRRRMDAANPLFIPRNHQIERAIAAAVAGDLQPFEDLRTVLRQPFDEQPRFAAYAEAPAPHERVTRTFCGT